MSEAARPTRADEVKSERRRQRGPTVLTGQKLGVSEAFLDRNKFEYRWLNDDGGRIEQMTTADDWDLVEDPKKVGKEDADGLGTKISKVVGRGESGAMRAYLARKPKVYYDEDQREKRASIKETMDAIKRGTPSTEATPLGDSGYIPDGGSGISIKDGRQ